MENIKLGYVHVPIIPHIYTTPYHSNYSHSKNNTTQEIREFTEEEKNFAKGFFIGCSILIVILILVIRTLIKYKGE